MRLRLAACLALALWGLASCTKAKRSPVIAAIEVPVTDAADRQALLGVLRAAARFDPSLHVDDATAAWMAMQARDRATPPDRRATFYAGVWRGAKDEESLVQAMDFLHPGRVWVMFENGSDPAADTRLRKAGVQGLIARFPAARALPVLPDGRLPLAQDLRLTPAGYRIAPDRAAAYGLPASSPLLAR